MRKVYMNWAFWGTVLFPDQFIKECHEGSHPEWEMALSFSQFLIFSCFTWCSLSQLNVAFAQLQSGSGITQLSSLCLLCLTRPDYVGLNTNSNSLKNRRNLVTSSRRAWDIISPVRQLKKWVCGRIRAPYSPKKSSKISNLFKDLSRSSVFLGPQGSPRENDAD